MCPDCSLRPFLKVALAKIYYQEKHVFESLIKTLIWHRLFNLKTDTKNIFFGMQLKWNINVYLLPSK